jgi:hypothetical protein
MGVARYRDVDGTLTMLTYRARYRVITEQC